MRIRDSVVLMLVFVMFAGARPSFASGDFIVISYHDVRDDLYDDMDEDVAAVGTLNIIRHFSWLKDKGYNVVSVNDLVAAAEGKKPLPEKAVLLTFDDGYQSMHTKVFPLLKLFNYPALLDIVGKWIDQVNAGAESVKYGATTVSAKKFLSIDQIKEMSESGLVEIASHSYNLHRGVIGNPQGNKQPSAVTFTWDEATGEYETLHSLRQRLRKDMGQTAEFFKRILVKRPRVMVWPFGAFNQIGVEEAKRAGMPISIGLSDGKNNVRDLTAVKRIFMERNPDLDYFSDEVRTGGIVRDPIRVAHIDLDSVYDPDPEQRSRNLDVLIERIYRLEINTVFLQAFADPDGDGVADALYFPNRRLPVRLDLFNRVAWQLRTRAQVKVYAWMPVLGFKLPDKKLMRRISMREYSDEGVVPSADEYKRLSPFNPEARKIIKEIYEDLAKSSSFAGILFHDDAFIRDNEDAGAHAVSEYIKWGFNMPILAILKDKDIADKWTRKKTEYLADFIDELIKVVRVYRPEIKTARNMYSRPLLEPESERWFAQSFDIFLQRYDYTALMTMPYMEKAANPSQWIENIAKLAAKSPGGLSKTIFELQSVNWRTDKPVPENTLLEQFGILQKIGAVNYGYYPDNFISNRPALDKIKRGVSLSTFPYVK